MAGGGGSGRRGELGSVPGAGRIVEGEVEGSFAKRKEGRRAGQRAQASGEAAHGTARRVRRRGASTAVLGVRAGRECRVERPRSFRRSQGRGVVRARLVAGGLDSDGDHGSASAEQGREERTERVERKRERN